LSMIESLRKQEDVLLHDNFLSVTDLENESVSEFLENEYELESLNYPFDPPLFHSMAALWAAQTVYITAQLLLCRTKEEQELQTLFPIATFEVNASTMLSVDLCLRFLPQLIHELRAIDSDDSLIEILDRLMHTWHFSGISHSLNIEKLDLHPIFDSQCLQQLYLNRITDYQNIDLALHPQFVSYIKGNLGLYKKEYWKTFNIATTDA